MPKVKSSGDMHQDADRSCRLIGTDEQQAIWDELHNGSRNMIVNSVAGSGKTTTGVEYCLTSDRAVNVLYVAFNTHIKTELAGRLVSVADHVQARTYHSLGNSIVGAEFGKTELDQYKVLNYLDTIKLPVASGKEKTTAYKIKNLVSLGKQYGLRSSQGGLSEELTRLADHHDVDLDGVEELAVHYAIQTLRWCSAMNARKGGRLTIDFDDMIWLPLELQLTAKRKADVMLIDEAQDTNLSQQYLALTSTKRLVVIGDRHQAIYGFRGSDNRSMDRLRDELAKWPNGVVEMGLTLTRRCPKRHVKLAQVIVPQIQALPESGEGVVRTVSLGEAYAQVKPGDMVICRVNADMIAFAWHLLKSGVPAVVRGRDIGEGIKRLIEQAVRKSGGEHIDGVVIAAEEITQEAVRKFLSMAGGKGEGRASAAQERLDCLLSLCEGVKTAGELGSRVSRLFEDFEEDGKPVGKVVLGTVHRTKGLEADRVFVLRPDLIPHPMARREWAQEQERNAAYIAVTRARKELVWVGQACLYFDGVLDESTAEVKVDASVDLPVEVESKPVKKWRTL